MSNFTSLMFAAAAMLTVGAGLATAQESAGGVNAGPFETLQLRRAVGASQQFMPMSVGPQAGSSDLEQIRAPLYPQQTLIGADGNG